MNNPLSNVDTKQFESAFGTAIEVVTDRLTDVTAALTEATETLGERVTDDVLPAAKRVADDVVPVAKRGADQTRTFVRTRTQVSVATVAGLALAVALVVWFKKRGDDAQDELATHRSAAA